MTPTATTSMPLDDDYDVVIVGARAAGAATALRLARAGLRVAAVDKGHYGSDTLSTNALARAGVLLLSRWGVLDTIRQEGTPKTRQMRFHYGPNDVTIDLEPRGDVDGLYSPRRSILDRVLVDAAVAAGAVVRHRTSVSGITRDDRHRVDGICIDDDGIERTIRARFVVGADGIRSRIAEAVGAPMVREEARSTGFLYAYFAGVSEPHVIENEFFPEHATGVIPTNDGEACVWIAVPSDQFRAQVADGIESAFARGFEKSPALQDRLAHATRASRFRSWPGRPGFLREGCGAGWALVGDSGYFKDPVSAHGITDALIGAELLSDALTDAVADPTNEDAALEVYERDRSRLASSMIPPVAKVASFQCDAAAIEDAFIEMSVALREEWDHIENRGSGTGPN